MIDGEEIAVMIEAVIVVPDLLNPSQLLPADPVKWLDRVEEKSTIGTRGLHRIRDLGRVIGNADRIILTYDILNGKYGAKICLNISITTETFAIRVPSAV